MKKYEPAKMEIVLFDDCAWTDVVTTSNTNNDTGVITVGSGKSTYSFYADDEFGDK